MFNELFRFEIDQKRSLMQISNSSKICKPEKGSFLLKLFAPHLMKTKSFKLLYRGSEHGFDSKAFHDKCDLKGSTLTFVKTDIIAFGAFTKAEWDMTERHKSDPEAFLFSLEDEKSFSIKQELINFAIFCSAKSGPTFG